MKLQNFLNLIIEHNKLRQNSLNLIASENFSSPLVKAVLSTDLGNRYASNFYGGTKFIRKIIECTEGYLRELFDCDYVLVSPLSGNLCHLALVLGLTKTGNKLMSVDAGSAGGYPLDYEFFGRKKTSLHFSLENMNILIEENINEIKSLKPSLVIFGASFLPFPEPVKEIVKEFEKNKTINFAYDGSHILGLIAGKEFQDPLKEGAHVLVGSTHKSFPGPQGGVILTNDMKRFETLQSILEIDLEKGIKLIDNNHPNRIAAVGITALELLEFGKDYAKQIVKNTKILAKSLDDAGVPVKLKHLGYSTSHQLLLNIPNYEKGEEIKNRAEKFGVMIDSGGRIGTSEITRMGMKELEMKEISEIFTQIYFNDHLEAVERKIRDLTRVFHIPSYCFNNIDEIKIFD